MLQLIFVFFLISASGEREEQRYVYNQPFESIATCKAKGAEIVSELSRSSRADVRGFAYVCIENGTPT